MPTADGLISPYSIGRRRACDKAGAHGWPCGCNRLASGHRASWRMGASGPRCRVRGLGYGLGFRGGVPLGSRLPALDSRLGGTSRSDVEPSAGMFRGRALFGPSLLERLLRRLLSELLGFLRALHLHPFLVAGSDRARGRNAKASAERIKALSAHAEYRTDRTRTSRAEGIRGDVRDPTSSSQPRHPSPCRALTRLYH